MLSSRPKGEILFEVKMYILCFQEDFSLRSKWQDLPDKNSIL